MERSSSGQERLVSPGRRGQCFKVDGDWVEMERWRRVEGGDGDGHI